MRNEQREKYNAWTWGIAAALALILLWLWITGRGPNAQSCCGAGSEVAAAATAATTAATVGAAPSTGVNTPKSSVEAAGSATNTVAAAPSAAAPAAPAAIAPAATTAAAVPAKPVATLYFDVGKTSAPADSAKQIEGVVAYLQKNPNSKAVISGYNDPSGNAAINAELSKNRAKSAREVLKNVGIEEQRIELRKPQDTNLSGDPRQARRVEISVEP